MARREVRFASKDEPLREDVSELGALVGAMLRDQGGTDFYARVEAARRQAIARRERRPGAARRLAEELCGCSAEDAAQLIRAFSAWFQQVNLAERVHRIRRRRDYEREQIPQPEGLVASLEKLRDAGMNAEQALDVLQRLSFGPVFTAHPTQSMRRSLLEKQQRLARRLLEKDDPLITPRERRAILARARMEISAAWQTEEHPHARPSVADERQHILFYLTDVLYDIIPPFYEALEEAFREVWPEAQLPDRLPGVVGFGSWVGGDMDGNPNVTATTVRESLDEHRAMILARYLGELDSLYRRLSQSRSRVEVSADLEQRIEQYRGEFPSVHESVPERHQDMPYRVLIRGIQARLRATLRDHPGAYTDAGELAEDIRLMYRSLAAHGGEHAGLFSVHRLLRRVETFGFHLASLDIRQDSAVHRAAVGALLGDPDWEAREPAERVERMRAWLADPPEALVLEEVEGEGLANTLEVFRAIRDCRHRHGEAAIGCYIISMTRGVEDLIAVLVLARAAGLVDASDEVPLAIVPLLETVPDLQAGPQVLGEALDDPAYRRHLNARGLEQQVMVGYSDSSKESGIAASRWAVYRTQVELRQVAEAAGVGLSFFHGRGGSAGRGGGKVHSAILASPPGSLEHGMRVTEQGEVIHAKYGLRSIAMRSLEQGIGGMLRSAVPGQLVSPGDQARQILETVAQAGRAQYQAMVYSEPEFEHFFQELTPIDVIQRMAISSRPASRRKGQGIEDLRAIPWVFAWTQCRLLLPGWYGLGAGLAEAERQYGLAAVQETAREWPFFAMMLADVEMVLAKADPDIAEQYLELVEPRRRPLFESLRSAYDETVSRLLAVKGREQLLEDDPGLARAIRLRNPYVDPMSLLQVDLLRRWRETDREDPALLDALIGSVNGIAQGLQNTG